MVFSLPSAITSLVKRLVLIALCCVAWAAIGGEQPQTNPVPKQAISKPANATTAPSMTNLELQSLTRSQQDALQPLSNKWSELSDPQKKKWIALSANFNNLQPAAKARLHDRMAQWAALTPRQRTLARLNFSATQRVHNEDKAERWEVYQTLTAEQKRALAASAPKPTLAPRLAPPSPTH